MAGYGLKSFLIAQSLNQIERAYGPNNSILDNCHIRVSFSSNDERTAKRVSDALGTATEMRSMRNYAGHRLSPWLGHVMVSRQETARPLLTPGEIMQLPPADEIVMVSGVRPIRAKKARYFEDRRFTERVLPSPAQGAETVMSRADDWSDRPLSSVAAVDPAKGGAANRARQKNDASGDPANAGLRREPDLPDHEEVAPMRPASTPEFTFVDEPENDEPARATSLHRQMVRVARQASLDPGDGLGV